MNMSVRFRNSAYLLIFYEFYGIIKAAMSPASKWQLMPFGGMGSILIFSRGYNPLLNIGKLSLAAAFL
ncbi:MAG: hypothetical protein IJ251_09760, partial [Oscillospiraceae bacterium]|nr:hypothetical protein [Oscillospiraceae bacterium]